MIPELSSVAGVTGAHSFPNGPRGDAGEGLERVVDVGMVPCYTGS